MTKDRSSIDAVLILESLSRLLRAAPTAWPNTDKALQSSYVDDSIRAVIDEADIAPEDLKNARAWAGTEWDAAFLNILFQPDDDVPTFQRMSRRAATASA